MGRAVQTAPGSTSRTSALGEALQIKAFKTWCFPAEGVVRDLDVSQQKQCLQGVPAVLVVSI